MGEPAQKTEEINVVDEFLNEGERFLEEEAHEEVHEEQETPEGMEEQEESASEFENEEEFARDMIAEEEQPVLQSEETEEKMDSEPEAQTEVLHVVEDENIEEETYEDNDGEIKNEIAAETSNTEDNTDYEAEALNKLKYHYSEMALLIDVLEGQVVDDKKCISNQKLYIDKMESDLIKYKKDAEEAMKNLMLTKSRLTKAEKKLDIVKRELLE